MTRARLRLPPDENPFKEGAADYNTLIPSFSPRSSPCSVKNSPYFAPSVTLFVRLKVVKPTVVGRQKNTTERAGNR